MGRSEKSFKNNKNPYLFPLIIQETLHHCDNGTLKAARLVSSLWELEANKLLDIKLHPVYLHENKYPNNNDELIRTNHIILSCPYTLDLEDILSHLLLDKKIPIKYLEIQSDSWNISSLECILRFLPSLEELTLSEDFILPKIDDDQDQDQGHIILSHLHTLNLNLCDEYLQNLANMNILRSYFSRIAPNIRKISSWNSGTSGSLFHTTIFSHLLFRCLVTKDKDKGALIFPLLSHLELNVDLRNEDLELLQSAGLPLKTLHLPLDGLSSQGLVDNLLSTLSLTLEVLKINYRNCIRKAPLLINLRGLKHFAIYGSCTEFKKKLHVRRRLSRSWWEYSQQQEMGLENFQEDDEENQKIYYLFNMVPVSLFPCFLENFTHPLEHLEGLHLNNVYYIPKDILNLKTFFPKLKILKVSFLDDGLLRCVSQNFQTSLEELGVKDGYFSDEALSGISPIVKDIIMDGGGLLRVDLLREFTSIKDLKYLRKLELCSKKVSDFGIINGLALCSSLQDLRINFPQMTDSGLRSILNGPMSLDNLIIKSGYYSPTMIHTARKKLRSGLQVFNLN